MKEPSRTEVFKLWQKQQGIYISGLKNSKMQNVW